MPIFYRYPHRVFFAHIPKTAGVAIYEWWFRNHFLIANLQLRDHGIGQVLRDRHGLLACQMEGPMDPKISPQHAAANLYTRWGPFTSSFTIVRNPWDRFVSELGWQFHMRCRQQKISEPTSDMAHSFAGSFVDHALSQYRKDPRVADNHIRPQTDFLHPGTDIIRFESDWAEDLRQRYALEGHPEHLNKSSRQSFDFEALIDPGRRRRVLDFYLVDFEGLDYDMPLDY